MKRIFTFGILFFISIFAILPNIHGRDNLSIRVQIMVMADPEIQSAIENQLKIEFRSLANVVVVNEKADFEIRVIALGPAAKEKENSGVAFSTVFLSPFSRTGIPGLISNRCKSDAEVLKKSEEISDARIYKDHLLQVGTPKDIGEICKDIASNFKTNFLEDSRPTLQKNR